MAGGITRLAPSPTGALHLGNARTFVVNALLAEQLGWTTRMRVEDLDGPRTKPGAAEAALDELAWLGLSWQGPVLWQSTRDGAYLAALKTLVDAGWAYPCTCSRKDVIEAASAPHAEGHSPVYPGTCRGRYPSGQQAAEQAGRPPAWRLRVDEATVDFTDHVAGHQHIDLPGEVGDFVIYRNEGLASYQLAVTIDDAQAGIDRIVRGDDLLLSAGQQIHLRRLLGLAPEPEYWHLPLVVGPDGRRLAKRHGDTRLAFYRRAGATPQRLLGLLACWCGVTATPRPMEWAELRERFDPAAVPREPIVFSETDHAYMLGD